MTQVSKIDVALRHQNMHLFIAGSECAELSLVQSRVWIGMALDRCVGAIDVASEAEQGEQQDGVDEGLR